MSKVYTINNGKERSEQIPSIEYIDELLKMIEDSIINIINKVGFEGFKSIDSDFLPLLNSDSADKNISAADVDTDSNHKFISEALLATFIDKPSSFEIEQSLTDVERKMENKINESYMKIVNTPNAINKLRDIANILNEDELINGIIQTISEKATIEQLKNHIDSTVHMNNNDRKALNILLKVVLKGFADWNAKPGDINAIKNKPNSLPADGGNADTVSNHGIKDIINKTIDDIVIGSIDENYNKDSCDIIIEECENIDKILNIGYGNILFKTGNYKFGDVNISSDKCIVIRGTKDVSIISFNQLQLLNNIHVKDVTIENSTVIISKNCYLDNINFINCIIKFNNTEDCDIKYCKFTNCKFVMIGSLMNNIITYNRLIRSGTLRYIGGNNIIKNNIGN